jgi:hypothetical protein
MTFGHRHGPLPSGDMQLALGLPTHISPPQVELARAALCEVPEVPAISVSRAAWCCAFVITARADN